MRSAQIQPGRGNSPDRNTSQNDAHLIRHACSTRLLHECSFLPGTSLGQLAQE